MLSTLISLAFFASALGEDDYCSLQKELCGTVPHIACNNSKTPSSSCSTDKFVDLDNLKDAITDQHNLFRNRVASGNLTKFKRAARLATMEWDYDLAKMASLLAKSCPKINDACINTMKFRLSGHNMAKKMWDSTKEPDTKAIVTELIYAWFNQSANADMNTINKITENNQKAYPFTVIIHQLSNKLGCSAVRSQEVDKSKTWQTFTLFCNYAHNNVLGYKVYEEGEPVSRCITGPDNNYNSLCSVEEKYLVNEPLE